MVLLKAEVYNFTSESPLDRRKICREHLIIIKIDALFDITFRLQKCLIKSPELIEIFCSNIFIELPA